jgi:hypothetical protein
MFGGLDPEGAEYKRARITLNGDPGDAVLYMFETEPEPKWKPVDRITGTKITETNKGMSITGTSRELIDTVGVDPADAQVRWEIQAHR